MRLSRTYQSFQLLTYQASFVPNDEHSTPFCVALLSFSSNTSLLISSGVKQLHGELAFSNREPQICGVDSHHALPRSDVHELGEFRFSVTGGKVVVASLKRTISARCNKHVQKHLFRSGWDRTVHPS